MMRFIEGKQYMVQVPGSQRVYRTTYTGDSEGDYNCAICGKDGWSRGKWSARHEFVEGDPNNPTWVFHFGTECIRKVKIALADGATEDRMGTMKDVFVRIEEAAGDGKGGAPPTVAKVLNAIMKVLKCPAAVANKIFAVYRGEKIIKIDGGTGSYETSHGQFWDKDVLERAVAMYDASESKYKKHKASDDMVKRAEEMMKEGW